VTTMSESSRWAGSRGRGDERFPRDLRDATGSRATGAAGWVDDLIDMLRFELEEAARQAVITTGESEQLLARLVLVIDQALSSTDTSPHVVIH
jgi:hypothetical protein